jgi:hypothetical protein
MLLELLLLLPVDEARAALRREQGEETRKRRDPEGTRHPPKRRHGRLRYLNATHFKRRRGAEV